MSPDDWYEECAALRAERDALADNLAEANRRLDGITTAHANLIEAYVRERNGAEMNAMRAKVAKAEAKLAAVWELVDEPGDVATRLFAILREDRR